MKPFTDLLKAIKETTPGADKINSLWDPTSSTDLVYPYPGPDFPTDRFVLTTESPDTAIFTSKLEGGCKQQGRKLGSRLPKKKILD